PDAEGSDPTVLDLLSDSLDTASRKFAPGGADREDAPTLLRIALRSDLDPDRYGHLLSNLVSRLSDRFSFIILDLGSETPGLIESAPAYSDVFVAIVEKPDGDAGVGNPRSMRVMRVINLFNPMSRPVPISSSEPFVVPRSTIFARPVDEATDFICANPRSAPGLPLYRLVHK